MTIFEVFEKKAFAVGFVDAISAIKFLVLYGAGYFAFRIDFLLVYFLL